MIHQGKKYEKVELESGDGLCTGCHWEHLFKVKSISHEELGELIDGCNAMPRCIDLPDIIWKPVNV